MPDSSLEPFWIEVSDGSMVQVVQEKDGTFKPSMELMDQVLSNMTREDPSIVPDSNEAMIITTVNTITGQKVFDYMHMVFNPDGRITVVCSDLKLRDSIQIERCNNDIKFWFATPEERSNVDPSGLFKIPEVPVQREKARKKPRYKQNQVSSKFSKGNMPRRLRKSTSPRKLGKKRSYRHSINSVASESSMNVNVSKNDIDDALMGPDIPLIPYDSGLDMEYLKGTENDDFNEQKHPERGEVNNNTTRQFLPEVTETTRYEKPRTSNDTFPDGHPSAVQREETLSCNSGGTNIVKQVKDNYTYDGRQQNAISSTAMSVRNMDTTEEEEVLSDETMLPDLQSSPKNKCSMSSTPCSTDLLENVDNIPSEGTEQASTTDVSPLSTDVDGIPGKKSTVRVVNITNHSKDTLRTPYVKLKHCEQVSITNPFLLRLYHI